MAAGVITRRVSENGSGKARGSSEKGKMPPWHFWYADVIGSGEHSGNARGAQHELCGQVNLSCRKERERNESI